MDIDCFAFDGVNTDITRIRGKRQDKMKKNEDSVVINQIEITDKQHTETITSGIYSWWQHDTDECKDHCDYSGE